MRKKYLSTCSNSALNNELIDINCAGVFFFKNLTKLKHQELRQFFECMENLKALIILAKFLNQTSRKDYFLLQ